MLRQHGLQVPFGLPELYAWHDGTDATTGVPLDDLHLFPGYYFLSLEDATRNYAAFRDDPRWNPAWLPIFANGGGDFFAVACRDGRSDWGGIVHFRIDEAEHPLEFSSVEASVETIAAAYKKGVFYVDEHGYLEMDDSTWIALAAEMNPDVPYWHDP